MDDAQNDGLDDAVNPGVNDETDDTDDEVVGFGPSILDVRTPKLNLVSFTPSIKVEGKGVVRSNDLTQNAQGSGSGTAPPPTNSQAKPIEP